MSNDIGLRKENPIEGKDNRPFRMSENRTVNYDDICPIGLGVNDISSALIRGNNPHQLT